MDVMRIVVVVVLLSLSGPGEARHTAVEAAPYSLAGQLLVATPELDDPNFRHTIVYMVEHDANGAVGVVVNRVLGAAPLGELLRRLGIEEGTDSEALIQIHFGGPVQLGRSFVLHSPDYRRDAPLAVGDLAAFSSSPEALRDMALGRGPRYSLFALGYAGWGADQLENEIARGDWLTIAPDEALLFDGADETKWRRALARTGLEL
jgi:putative transcriptional regulator